MEAELKAIKENHRTALTRMEREHEEKVLFLLGQMPKAEVSVVSMLLDSIFQRITFDSYLRRKWDIQTNKCKRLYFVVLVIKTINRCGSASRLHDVTIVFIMFLRIGHRMR